MGCGGCTNLSGSPAGIAVIPDTNAPQKPETGLAYFRNSRSGPKLSSVIGYPVEKRTTVVAHDRALTLSMQQEMQKHSPCRQTFTIGTDHSPFLSTPEQLADILSRIGSL